MSLWQHKNLHKRHLLWLKLVGICFFFHSSVLVWVFFIYNNDSYDISLSLNKNIDYSSPILFVPLSQQATISKTVPSTQKETPVIPVALTKENAAPQKTAPIKQAETTSLVTQKAEEKKHIKKEIPAQEKKEPKEAQKVEPPKQKETKKEPEPQKQPAAITKQENTHKAVQSTEKKHMAPAIKDNAQISHNYKEVEALRRTALLQKELVANWKPPVGMPAHTACEISFFVDKQGGVKNISMTKSSGIMMYDISARQALFSMKMPQWTYGKTITINFT